MHSIVTDNQTIKDLIQEAVQNALRNELPGVVRRATQKPWMTRDQLKDLTGWSDRTLQHLRDSGQIPYSQHGRKILYPSDGIMEFLDAHRIEPRQ